MKIKQLYTNCLAQGAYYISHKGEAAIIDPLRETKPYLDMLAQNNDKLKFIFETHFHADFVSGHIDLAASTGATIVFGPTANTTYKSHIASDNEESGLTVDVLNVKGELYETINKKAEELGCSLIVLALDETAKFKSGMFGGGVTVPKFLTAATCPVITLRSTESKDGYKNIVMPFDLTPESREKVSFAVQLAHYYKADIRIVSVFKPNDDEYENKLLPYLQQVKKFIKQEGVHCTNRSLPSTKPAEAIIEYAVKNDCDLIIQINQRDVSFTEMLNGGALGHKIVELSPIPVLNVPPMKRESMSHFSSGM